MDFFERIIGLFWPARPPVLPSDIVVVSPPVPAPASPVAVAPVVVPIGSQADPGSYRRWRLTYYYIADQINATGAQTVPVVDRTGTRISTVEPSFFSSMGLQGSGRTRSGLLLNVQGMVSVKHEDYAAVWEYHKAHLAKRAPGYSGLVVKDDRVIQAQSFRIVPSDQVGKGYGTIRGIPLEPFRTVAADIGALTRHEPRWKGKGGVCPPLTRVFIKEFVGHTFPDGKGLTFIHDGWLVVNDTGGGIFGKHFDIFAGSPALAKKVSIPEQASVWYKGITERVPPDDQYNYGLHDA